MTNDDRWLLAAIVVECATAAMVVVDGGNSEASEGKRARVDEGARARAMVYMADDNGKQQERFGGAAA